MDKLEFKSLDGAAYTANRLLTFIDRLERYARRAPVDLSDARRSLLVDDRRQHDQQL